MRLIVLCFGKPESINLKFASSKIDFSSPDIGTNCLAIEMCIQYTSISHRGNLANIYGIIMQNMRNAKKFKTPTCYRRRRATHQKSVAVVLRP